ncbi:MAG: hypothetical protein JST00_08810 [Deltaproteobacteria bacterium]|nr:hypothetical protein [Deltaproteobacteria bacterium]
MSRGEMPKLPSPEHVTRLLADLVGRRVIIHKTTRMAKTELAGAASYVDGAGRVRYVAAVNVAFLASSGAALALFPVGAVADAIQSGKLPANMLENAYEILNVASALMNEMEGAVHVKIAALDLAPSLPETVRAVIEKPLVGFDMEVEISGYPKGKLSLMSANVGRA